MPARWTTDEEDKYREQLHALYVRDNRTISEIGKMLGISQGTVYDRLVRLGIPSLRKQKPRYNNQRNDIVIPKTYSVELAEFIGALLGDGHISQTQVTVTLGTKDLYVPYVRQLIQRIFGIAPGVTVNKLGHQTVYFGSTAAVRWLREMGLVFNKVKEQVGIPAWIKSDKNFMRAALRGLYDTDGSVYRLRWGMQISFCNHSRRLSEEVRGMLSELGFSPSKISGQNLYLTKKQDIARFFQEIGFNNEKHRIRYNRFMMQKMGASDSGNSGTL